MPDLVEVYRDARIGRAQLIEAALHHHQLHCTVVSDGLAAMVGASSNAVPARVLVPSSEADRARLVIAALEVQVGTEPDPADYPATCPTCASPWEPGFAVCWSCQHDLAAAD